MKATLNLAKVRYLVVYGAKKRSIRHIGRQEPDGTWVPICNVHYTARNGRQERQVRSPHPTEDDYPVCKRCQAWWKPEMVTGC